jgi:hypothetical protein
MAMFVPTQIARLGLPHQKRIAMKQLSIVLFLLFPLLAASQESGTQTIRGTVIDLQSQMPIPGVRIEVITTTPAQLGVTDVDGRFRIDNVPVGRHTIQFTSMGYEMATVANAELRPAKELILNIQMEESVITAKEVEVKAQAEKGEVNNEMATVSSRTFNIDESKRYAGSLNDVARMAQNFAGVQGNNDSRNDIVIRGNSPIGVLYRLEGVDIPNPNHFAASGTTGGPVSMLNNNLLANSDFMTGAFPAEYGNALSGVFDLKLRAGNNEKHEFLGQIGFNGAELMAEGPLNKKSGASYLVSYRYSTLELFDLMGISFGTAAIPKYQDGAFKLNFPNKKGSFQVFGMGGLSNVALLESETDSTDLFAIGGTDTYFNSNVGVVGAGQTLLLDNKTYLRWTLSVNGHQTKVVQDSITPVNGEDPVPYYRDNSVRGRQTLSAYINHKASAQHVVRAGIFANRMFFHLSDSIYRRTLNQFVSLSDFDGGVFLLQPYAQYQYKPTRNLSLTAGVHYAWFERANSHSLEPRAGLRYKLGDRNTLTAGYGLHSQLAPLDFYFDRVDLPNGNQVIPNKNLKPTKAHHMIVGHEVRLSENVRLKTEAYYQILFNVPVDVQTNTYSLLNEGADFGVGSPDSLVNTGAGRNMGLELTFEHFLNKGFYFLVTASLYDSRYKGSDNVWRNTAFNGNYAFNGLVGKEFELNRNKKDRKSKMFLTVDAKSTLNGGRRYSEILLNESIAAGFTLRDTENAFEKVYPYYWRTDLRLGFKVYGKKVTQEWAVDLQNIANRKNVFTQDFDAPTQSIFTTYQIGFLPIVQYRIYF